jgi:uncharacterized protein
MLGRGRVAGRSPDLHRVRCRGEPLDRRLGEQVRLAGREAHSEHRRQACPAEIAVELELQPRDVAEAPQIDVMCSRLERPAVRARGLHADQARHGQARLTRISITVSPGAVRSEVVGRHGDGWRARVAAPPERGRANEALVELLAAALNVPRARIRVVGGQTSRRKIVEVEGLDGATVQRRLG